MRKSDIRVLSQTELFAGLSEEEILAAIGDPSFRTATYKKNEAIFTPEKYEKALVILLKGSADVCKETGKGTLFLSILSPGDVFGMAAMFYEENGFINTVRAREDCRVLIIGKEQLTRLLYENRTCMENYITVLSGKIHYLNEKLLYLTSPSPTGRLLSWLTDESERQGSAEFRLPVSYSELALLLSLGRTSVYRSFDELEEKGKLTRNGRIIKLYPSGKEDPS